MKYLVRAGLLVFLFVFTAFPALAEDRFLDIQDIKSQKGITAWLVEDHTLPIIAIQFTFTGAGAKLDPEGKQGLARMASNTMDEGAGDLDSQTFQGLLTNNSISLSFGSNRDDFSGSLKTLARHKDIAFNLMTLALTKPRFDEEPVERMRQANLARIRSSMSDPEWIAARIMNDVTYEDHPYARNSGGTLTSLLAITPDDLRGFVKNNLSRDRLKIAAAGDITPDELKTVLDQIFGDLPEKSTNTSVEDTTIKNGGMTVLYEMDIPQTMIQIMQPGIDRHDPDYYPAQIMNYVLGSSGFGSRLTEEVREKRGLTYGIYTYFSMMDHVDTLALGTSTKNESAKEVLNLISQEWQKMYDDGATEKELADAKAYLIGSMPLSLSSTDKIAGLVLSLLRDDLPIDYLDQRADRIDSVTKEDILRVAKRILEPENLTTVLVGKPENVEISREIKSIPDVE